MRAILIFSILVATQLPISRSWAQDNAIHGTAFAGPYFKCPDAHGAEQKKLFKIIDISKLPMRIEGMGEIAIIGVNAAVKASAGAKAPMGNDAVDANPFHQAFGKLAVHAQSMNANTDRRLVAVCFATTPPPTGDVDGPFNYLPGFFADPLKLHMQGNASGGFDSVIVPPKTYLVLHFHGQARDVGNFRFTLTEDFWPKVAPRLGLQRIDGPNVMIYQSGGLAKEDDAEVDLEMWTPIKSYGLKR